ncbi:MAG TPA: hypothetical protein HA260_01365 [Thermoplasmata archaeon]|jgi:hypothetical protein|nr:hypothetical protein [Thermoplasmata archaeon]
METPIPSETSINDYTQDSLQPPKQPSSKPLIAGIFLVIAGLLGLLTWASALALDVSVIQNVLPPESPITAEQLQSFLTTCGVIGAVLSIFTLAGGIVAMRRKAWGLAVIGGILGLFTIGPILLGSILSLIGLIIVAISRNDFQ